MSDISTQEWRFIFDITLMSLLFLLLLLTLVMIFFKQKNVPVSQCIEVDPREPHSITITFVPAQLVGTNINNSNETSINANNNNNNNETPLATATAHDLNEMTQQRDRGPSTLSRPESQTAPLA